MTRPLDGAGTCEAAWLGSGVLDALPELDPAACRPAGRAVVVAPHPDDEVLGAGGVLACWAALGTPVLVVAVTDGDASHPTSPTLTPMQLAELRTGERRDALVALGIGIGIGTDDAVVRLGLPDGAVTAEPVAERLTDLLAPTDTLLAPVRHDGHPDHDATAAAAIRAADAVGAPRWSYPVWLWHWAHPHDPSGPVAGAIRLALPASARRAKAAAIACFTTQIAPLSPDPGDAAILPPEVRARFTREFEVLWGPR